MGNCWNRCFGIKVDRRKYLRTRYSVERDFSIEFENLMDDDIQDDMQKPLTDREKELLTSKKYDAIVHEQKRIDTEIETQLARQEEELRLEEEAYYEAKREAARLSRLQRAKEQASRSKITAGSTQPAIQDAEWDITEGEDDFEMFLESVKARSITARAIQRRGSGDGQSSSSSTTHTKDRSHTEASSIDLEWEHEAGMVPQQRGLTDDTLSSLVSKTHSQSPNTSNDLDNDLEWDNDFVSSDTIETEQLITKPEKIQRQGNKLLLSKR